MGRNTINRRITGTLIKQVWGGRKNDQAIEVGRVEFDATDHILLMSPEEIRELEDGDESTDAIGQAHFVWDGPTEVEIAEAVCRFFGVDDVEDITDEAVAYAKAQRIPALPTTETVTLKVKLTLKLTPGASVNSFIEDCDYRFTSNTAGAIVQTTEIVDAD